MATLNVMEIKLKLYGLRILYRGRWPWRMTTEMIFFTINLHENHVAELGIEHVTPGSIQLAHDVETTLLQRRCNVVTLHRRWGDAV